MSGIKLQGEAGYTPEVEQNSKALRVVQRPQDLALGGHYKVSALTGIMAAGIAGASEILQFRWLSTTHNAKIDRVRLRAAVLGTAFTAGTVTFAMTIARGWTVVGTGGGVVTATGNQLKLRTSQLTSQMATASEANGSIRVATTAALGAGTKTLDSAPVGSFIAGVPNTAFIDMLAGHNGILFEKLPGQEPITLAASEGFSIITTVPATGTWTAHIEVDWREVPTSVD